MRSVSGTRKWAAGAVAAALLLLTPALLGSCVPQSVQQTAPTPLPSPTPTLQPLPTPVPTQPTQGPELVPAEITQEEAQTEVRAWFDAILAQDYETAAGLTTGSATDRTRELSEGFHRATGGNAVELSKTRLDLTPGDQPTEGEQAVKSDFDIQVNAKMGPITVAVQQISGSATFIVQRASERILITDIRDVTGLPTS